MASADPSAVLRFGAWPATWLPARCAAVPHRTPPMSLRGKLVDVTQVECFAALAA